ncbi:MAG: hypothetical protein RL161_11 [Bacteroidota bacterium]|jgi:imidazolonepropionase-like amidohydrolase
MKKIINTFILVVLVIAVQAQVPIPAQPQQKPVLIVGATIHTAAGQPISNGAVAFENGKITYVGAAATAPANRSAFEVIDATGKHVYPGFVLPNSRLGLQEIESIRATVDSDEAGEFNPNVRSLISYNTDSEHIAAYRFNGILLVEAAPVGGVISGTSSVMQLDGWNWEDAAHTADVAIHLNWPGLQRVKFDFETFSRSTESNSDYGKNVEEINSFFNDALAYSALAGKEVNLKFEAMQGLFSGSKSLIIHANRGKEVVDAVTFAKSKGVKKIAVACGDDALHITEFLKANDIGVVVPSVHTLPIRDDEAIDLQYSLAALLSKAGVKVAFSHTGSLGTGRNLPFYAGTAIAHGMDPQEALKALTIYPARMIGVDTKAGTLETGKDATLFISAGDALDFRTNKISEAFIGGKKIVLNNKHEELYDRYSKKYGHRK